MKQQILRFTNQRVVQAQKIQHQKQQQNDVGLNGRVAGNDFYSTLDQSHIDQITVIVRSCSRPREKTIKHVPEQNYDDSHSNLERMTKKGVVEVSLLPFFIKYVHMLSLEIRTGGRDSR
ncbi:hypothetical protein CEXT_170571 [Caerostris extrusa]|uniref:Uncharacterized protein n=1 Tax=Caerostris extrusa TaxID=172846 RepID=A0AAV4XJ73_CAEEX|nr:hypothetical protein CEXT_170571 [Caerostris extrusa]